MSDLIQWPKAVYWTTQYNPIAGCKPCSPACANCYAKAWADRFKISFVPHRTTKQKPPKKGVCFCGNVTDLFGDWVTEEESINYISRAQVNGSKDAVYLWLTKRPQRMCDALNHGWVCEKDYHPGEDILPEALGNHYFGFTAENQEWYDRRSEEFAAIWKKSDMFNLWISAEPLLGPIELRGEICKHLSWVVVGAESGGNRRPCNIEWVEDIVDECLTLGVPVFIKQIVLPSGKFTNKIEDFPKHLQIRQVPWAQNGTKGEENG